MQNRSRKTSGAALHCDLLCRPTLPFPAHQPRDFGGFRVCAFLSRLLSIKLQKNVVPREKQHLGCVDLLVPMSSKNLFRV